MPKIIYKKATHPTLSRKDIAHDLLGHIEWISDSEGYCRCPGEHLHTHKTGVRDCKVFLPDNGAPSIKCFHSSCEYEINDANHKLRSEIGRVEALLEPSRAMQVTQVEPVAKAYDWKSDLKKLQLVAPWKTFDGTLNTDQISDSPRDHYRMHLALFDDQDWLWIGDRHETATIHPVSRWKQLSKPSGRFISFSTYRPESTARQNCNILEQRYLIVESDTLTKADQAKVLRWIESHCGWTLRAIVDTGGKSLHGWFVMPRLLNKDQIRALFDALEADKAMLTPSQPSRIAGRLREASDDAQSHVYQRFVHYSDQVQQERTWEEICTVADDALDEIEDLAELDLPHGDFFRFDEAQLPPPEPAIATLAGKKVATAGNITVITGGSGVAKTRFASALLASTFGKPDGDYLGWSAYNTNGKGVLYVDFEMSHAKFAEIMLEARNRAGVESVPSWFASFCATNSKQPLSAQKATISSVLDHIAIVHGGIHMIFLDGFADLMKSPNDEEKSYDYVFELRAFAAKYQCPVIGVIHTSSTSEASKMRGHLGSQLDRKGETALLLKRQDDDSITVTTLKQRHAPIREADGVRFAWDDEQERFVSVKECKVLAPKALRNSPQWAEIVSTPKRWGEVTDALQSSGMGKKDANQAIRDAIQAGDLTSKGKYPSVILSLGKKVVDIESLMDQIDPQSKPMPSDFI